jgi:hypothetical protein
LLLALVGPVVSPIADLRFAALVVILAVFTTRWAIFRHGSCSSCGFYCAAANSTTTIGYRLGIDFNICTVPKLFACEGSIANFGCLACETIPCVVLLIIIIICAIVS